LLMTDDQARKKASKEVWTGVEIAKSNAPDSTSIAHALAEKKAKTRDACQVGKNGERGGPSRGGDF